MIFAATHAPGLQQIDGHEKLQTRLYQYVFCNENSLHHTVKHKDTQNRALRGRCPAAGRQCVTADRAAPPIPPKTGRHTNRLQTDSRTQHGTTGGKESTRSSCYRGRGLTDSHAGLLSPA